jgi:hypothetical protein
MDLVGIPNEEWHINVIQAAIRKRGKYLEKQHITNGSCKSLISSPDKMYIVDGILNRGFYLKIGKGKLGQWRHQSGHDVYNRGESWRHCIGIRNRRIRCTGVHHTGISTDNLHLDLNGYFLMFMFFFDTCENPVCVCVGGTERPIDGMPTRGYMKRIIRVYSILDIDYPVHAEMWYIVIHTLFNRHAIYTSIVLLISFEIY